MRYQNPTVYRTEKGTLYLKEPGVSLVAMPQFLPEGATQFVNSFDDEFDAAEYENDFYADDMSAARLSIDDGAALCKFAGQTCYLSFGEKRTKNAEAKKYFDNIKSSGHGSVLQHANYSFIFWGIDRACSHELVRHAVGTGFSQMSQRYVSGKLLRFVERPEYQNNERLHFEFETWIDKAQEQYNLRAELLLQAMAPELEKLPPTDRRKAVNQAARNCLPNETETAMVMTGNVRAWRHILEMRASMHADAPISKLLLAAGHQLVEVSPILFDDYSFKQDDVRKDRGYVETKYRKV